jgi:putative membrane protein
LPVLCDDAIMSDLRDVLADNVGRILAVAGVGLLVAGGVGPGPVGIVSVFGIVTLLAAGVLASPIARLLRTDEGDTEGETDPLAALRDRYVAGEIDETEFERRAERLLAEEDVGTRDATAPSATDRQPEPETE